MFVSERVTSKYDAQKSYYLCGFELVKLFDKDVCGQILMQKDSFKMPPEMYVHNCFFGILPPSSPSIASSSPLAQRRKIPFHPLFSMAISLLRINTPYRQVLPRPPVCI